MEMCCCIRFRQRFWIQNTVLSIFTLSFLVCITHLPYHKHAHTHTHRQSQADQHRISHAGDCLGASLTFLSVSCFGAKRKIIRFIPNVWFFLLCIWLYLSESLRGRDAIQSNSFSVEYILNVNRNCVWFANDRVLTLHKMNITSLSLSLLNWLGGFLNWLTEGELQTAMQDVALCCGKIIWDKCDTAVCLSCTAQICR